MQRKINSQLNAMSSKKVFFEKTPEIILDNIARLEGILLRYCNAAGPSQDMVLFYEGILRILKMSYFYIQDTQFIHDRNQLLESYVKFLAANNLELEKRVNEYETLTKLTIDQRLEEVAQTAEAFVKKALHQRDIINNGNSANETP